MLNAVYAIFQEYNSTKSHNNHKIKQYVLSRFQMFVHVTENPNKPRYMFLTQCYYNDIKNTNPLPKITE